MFRQTMQLPPSVGMSLGDSEALDLAVGGEWKVKASLDDQQRGVLFNRELQSYSHTGVS
jgi:hypothetical protein